MSRRSIVLRAAAGLAVTAFFLWMAFHGRDITGLWTMLWQQPVHWFLLLFLLQVVSHLLRAYRWIILLEPVKERVPLFTAFSALMIGFMFNGLIPRAGEVARSYVLGRRMNVPASAVFSTVILERLLDFATFAFLLCVVAVLNVESLEQWFHIPHEARWLLYALTVGLLALFLLLFLRANLLVTLLHRLVPKLPMRFRPRLVGFLDSFEQGFRASRMEKHYPRIGILSLLTWSVYTLLLYLPLHLFGMGQLTMTSAITMQVANGLSAAMPTPNGLGSYHTFMTYTLTTILHAESHAALAYVVYTHAIGYLTTLTIGAFFLLRENLRLTELARSGASSIPPSGV